MGKLSVIIPSRLDFADNPNAGLLAKTVNDLLTKATGDIEIIPVLDGYWPNPPLVNDKRIVPLHRDIPRGMRASINLGAAIAKGDWLMKCDDHCMFGEGFDEILKADCDDNTLAIPRRKRLDAENWCIQDVGKPDVDYEFLSYPFWHPEEPGIHGTIWVDRALERRDKPKYDIDEDMSSQGSCWFISKEYFDRIGKMQEQGYGTFIGEPQELGLKVWLGGGRQIRNKKTWYAHLHKGKKYGRGYSIGRDELRRGNLYSVDHWYNNRWKERVHDFEWLIEHFWPVPTWPSMERSEWTPLNLS